MNRWLLILVCAALAAGAVPAQQSGTLGRDYMINGSGSGIAGPVDEVVPINSLAVSAYWTLDPNQPVVWGASPDYNPGWQASATNSVDIGPGNFTQIGNGADSSDPFGSSYFTNASGYFSISTMVPNSTLGTTTYFQMGHASAGSPDGYFVSQAHRVTFTLVPNLQNPNTTCTAGGTVLTSLTDDSFAQVAIGFALPFYNSTYTQCFVGSNGYITFASGDTDNSPTPTEFLNGPPRISGLWADLDPVAGGTVVFFTNGSDRIEVCWQNVESFGSINPSPNFIRVSVIAGTDVSFHFGILAKRAGLVGLSPGGGATGVSIDLSLGSPTITAGQAPYELFNDTTNVVDVEGFAVVFSCDATGTPISQS